MARRLKYSTSPYGMNTTESTPDRRTAKALAYLEACESKSRGVKRYNDEKRKQVTLPTFGFMKDDS